MVIYKRSPSAMTHTRGLLSRRDDVGKENAQHHHVALGCLVTSGEELLDFIHKSIGVAKEEQMVIAGQFDVLGAGNVFGHVPTCPHPDEAVPFSMKDQCGHRQVGQEMAFISPKGDPHSFRDDLGIGAETLGPRVPTVERGIAFPARIYGAQICA